MKKNKDKIVVFGGSFNPLTKAHGEIMLQAMNLVNAKMGIFLPAANSFMNSWKSYQEDDILDTSLRIKILNEFIKRHSNIIIETIEIDGITSKTYDSLTYLKNKYDADIFFIFGNEKYDELERWYRFDDLLNEFKLILVNRSSDNFEEIIATTPLLKKHKDHIITLKIDDKYHDISSSRIRDDLKNKDYKDLNSLTYDYVIKLLLGEKE